MILIRLLMALTAVLLGAVAVTQIIIPALMNRTFFPMFRKEYRKAARELAEARRQEQEAQLEQEAAEKENRAARIKVDTHIETNKIHDDLMEAAESLDETTMGSQEKRSE